MTTQTISRKDKIIYWTTTGIIIAVMFWSSVNFFFIDEFKDAFTHLGLPNWFRIELTIAKLLGVLALFIPTIPNRIKEFAYFGFAITLISTPIAHLSSGDSIWFEVGHLFFFVMLVISYLYFHKIENAKKHNIVNANTSVA